MHNTLSVIKSSLVDEIPLSKKVTLLNCMLWLPLLISKEIRPCGKKNLLPKKVVCSKLISQLTDWLLFCDSVNEIHLPISLRALLYKKEEFLILKTT